MIIWNFLNTYHLQKYYFAVTSKNSKNNLNILFKKALAIEAHHPEEAIKYYDKIIQHEDEIQKEKPLEKKFFSDVFQHKGFALKKLGMREDAQKCFTTSFTISNAIFSSSTFFTMSELEKIDKQFDKIWSKIVKNEGKLMKTKTGNVFSYRITKYKTSIMPIWHFQKPPKFPKAGPTRYISKNLIKNAFDVFPTKGPMELKKLLDLQSLDSAATHLWGILNDSRIYKK